MSPFHQSPPTPWPGLIEDVPPEFQRFVAEPWFNIEGVPMLTVCLWRRSGDTCWEHGAITLPTPDGDPDGAGWLFEELDGRAETYRDYALHYFEKEIELDPIRHVYEQKPLTRDVVALLNPELSLPDLTADLDEIGYPSSRQNRP